MQASTEYAPWMQVVVVVFQDGGTFAMYVHTVYTSDAAPPHCYILKSGDNKFILQMPKETEQRGNSMSGGSIMRGYLNPPISKHGDGTPYTLIYLVLQWLYGGTEYDRVVSREPTHRKRGVLLFMSGTDCLAAWSLCAVCFALLRSCLDWLLAGPPCLYIYPYGTQWTTRAGRRWTT